MTICILNGTKHYIPEGLAENNIPHNVWIFKSATFQPKSFPLKIRLIVIFCTEHNVKSVLSAYLPVRAVQGKPVLGRRSCRGCRAHGGQGLVAWCPEAGQHSHREGKNHLTLKERQREIEREKLYFARAPKSKMSKLFHKGSCGCRFSFCSGFGSSLFSSLF